MRKLIPNRPSLVCIGDMNKRITLKDRKLTQPVFGAVDFTETFGDIKDTKVWARIDTVSGKAIFAGVNGDILVTHEFYIRHDPTVTSPNTWIQYDDRRFRIVATNRLMEDRRFMKLSCTERGTDTLAATEA